MTEETKILKVLGYGEDFLTFWAISKKLGEKHKVLANEGVKTCVLTKINKHIVTRYACMCYFLSLIRGVYKVKGRRTYG